jgi:hypothetical protein
MVDHDYSTGMVRGLFSELLRDGLPLLREHAPPADARPGQIPARSGTLPGYTTSWDAIVGWDGHERRGICADAEDQVELGPKPTSNGSTAGTSTGRLATVATLRSGTRNSDSHRRPRSKFR